LLFLINYNPVEYRDRLRDKNRGLCNDLTDELVAVAADGVKGEGEPHADDGAQEEAHEDHLLLNIDLHRRPDRDHHHFFKRS
jgi:hypothetical protein